MLTSLIGGIALGLWEYGWSGGYAQQDESGIQIQSGLVPQNDVPVSDSKKKIIGTIVIVFIFLILIVLITKKRK